MAAKPPSAKTPVSVWPGSPRLDESADADHRPKDIWINNYAAVETAVMETPRGRWFLAEHARRNRLVEGERVLKAIAILARRFERGAEPDEEAATAALRQEIGALQDQIGQLKAAITAEAPADPAPTAAPALADLGDIADRLHLAGFDRAICETFDQQLGVLSRIAEDAVETQRRHAQLLSLVDIVERRLARLSGRAADVTVEAEAPVPETSDAPAATQAESIVPPVIVPDRPEPVPAAVAVPPAIGPKEEAPPPAAPAPQTPRETVAETPPAPQPAQKAPELKPQTPKSGSLAKTIAEIFAWHDSELPPLASKPAPTISAADSLAMTQPPSLAPDIGSANAVKSEKVAAATPPAGAIPTKPAPKAIPDILDAAPAPRAAEAQVPDSEAAQARDAIETARAARANDDSSATTPAPPPDFVEPPLLGRPDPGPLGPVAAEGTSRATPKPAFAAPPPPRAIPKVRYELAEIAAMAPRERLAFFS